MFSSRDIQENHNLSRMVLHNRNRLFWCGNLIFSLRWNSLHRGWIRIYARPWPEDPWWCETQNKILQGWKWRWACTCEHANGDQGIQKKNLKIYPQSIIISGCPKCSVLFKGWFKFWASPTFEISGENGGRGSESNFTTSIVKLIAVAVASCWKVSGIRLGDSR